MTFFCPHCWLEIREQDRTCSHCRCDLSDYERLPMEEKLILSLRHPAREYRMLAVQLLGDLGSNAALPHFETLMKAEHDYFFLREVLRALAKIDTPESQALMQRLKRPN